MRKALLIILVSLFALPQVEAQRFKDPRAYYREFSSQTRRIQTKNLRYVEAVARGDDSRIINKFRQMVVDQLKESRKVIDRVGPYNDDDVLQREYLGGIDMYLEAYEKDFGAAEDLTANRYNSLPDLEAYYAAANVAEVKVLEAAFKIEKAEDYFGKTYKVDLRRDTVLAEKLLRLDDIIVMVREVTLEYFRVDAQLQRLFKAIDSDSTDMLNEIITDLRKSIKTAQIELEAKEPMEGYDDLHDQAFYFFDEVNASIDEELRPMAEVFEFKYKDQDDLEKAQKTLNGYKEFRDDMYATFFETRKELILDYLEE